MIRKQNALIICVIIFLLSGCSNKSITNISNDLRKVDVLNKNKEIVKTYYQAFNNKVYDWLNVTCDFTKKKFKKIQDCKLTQFSKSFIKKQENENSTVNIASNKSPSSNERNLESNGDNNQAPSDNPPNNNNEPAEENFNNPPQENMEQQFENCNDPQRC